MQFRPSIFMAIVGLSLGSFCNNVRLIFQVLIRRTSPVLFAITMGTGSISNLFVSFPYGTGSDPMIFLSLIFFFLNLLLFLFFFALSVAKYTFFPQKWSALMKNPVSSLYTGCFPMGATTLINIAVQIIHVRYINGAAFLLFIWAIWWVDVVISFLCCWVGVHIMMTFQYHSLESMTAMWLLPVVTLIVASSTGGILAKALQTYSTTHALTTIAVSAFMVTTGLTIAFMILTIYFLRLFVHGLPSGWAILSVFLPLGPTGQAGYAVLLIGQNLNTIIPLLPNNTSVILTTTAGIVIDTVCTCLAFLLWSLATMWILYAFLAFHNHLRKSSVTFRISFWGLVFPNGVYANLTIQLGNALNSKAFRTWGSIYAFATLLLWLLIFMRSIWELKSFFPLQEQSDESHKIDVQDERIPIHHIQQRHSVK